MPLVLAQLYHDLYSFINIDKINMIITYAGLLQVWAYEHIIVGRLVRLHSMRNDMIGVAIMC